MKWSHFFKCLNIHPTLTTIWVRLIKNITDQQPTRGAIILSILRKIMILKYSNMVANVSGCSREITLLPSKPKVNHLITDNQHIVGNYMQAAEIWFHRTIMRTSWTDWNLDEDILREENWLPIFKKSNPVSFLRFMRRKKNRSFVTKGRETEEGKEMIAWLCGMELHLCQKLLIAQEIDGCGQT